MLKNYESKLKFINYVVDTVEFRNNPNFEANEVSIDFNIRPEYINDDGDLIVILEVDVFKDAVANNYPFELSIRMIGYFKLEGEGDADKFRENALAIMYPYVRALVTGYTSNSNVSPLILPVINVNAMFNRNEKK
jgi:preprotein translocase subunit SecB